MTKRQGRWMVAIALGAALVAGVPADVLARTQKPTIKGRINGKQFKAWSRGVSASYGNPFFIIGTGTKPGRSIRAFAFGCLIFEPPTTFPATYTCNGNYNETRIGRRPSVKVWGTLEGLQVTFDSFGSRAEGTVSGTLEIGENPPIPVAVEGVRFSVPLVQ